MRNTNDRSVRAAVLVAALLAPCGAGCSDFPLPELKALNPLVREQWQQDEREVTTYHRKVADLAALRSKARTMPPAEQEQVAFHLSERLREEKSPVLRGELVRTLGEFPAESAKQAVLQSLIDEAPAVRVAACKAMGRHPTADECFQALSRTVTSDADVDVRIAAAHELGKFRGFAAPKALRPALDERDPALQLAVIQSLESLAGHQEYRRHPTTWREFLDGGNPAPPPPPSLADLARQVWYWY
jgi:HEAT repeat protein